MYGSSGSGHDELMKIAVKQRRGKDVSHLMHEGGANHMSHQGEGDGAGDTMSGGSQHDLGTMRLSHSGKTEHEDDTKMGDLPQRKGQMSANTEHEDNGIARLHEAEAGGEMKRGMAHEEMEEGHDSDASAAGQPPHDLDEKAGVGQHLIQSMSAEDVMKAKARGPRSIGERAAMMAHQKMQEHSALKSAKKPY